MQFITNLVAPLAMATAALGAALPTRPGFTSHEVTKPDGSKDVLYLHSDFVSTSTGGIAARDPPAPASVPFTASPNLPVANCPVEMAFMGTDAATVPPASVSDCQALMSAMDKQDGYWSATNWLAMVTLAQVGTCKFSAFRWDGKPDELKVGNLDVWGYLSEATTNHVVGSQIMAYGNGPCGGDNDPAIRFDIGNTSH